MDARQTEEQWELWDDLFEHTVKVIPDGENPYPHYIDADTLMQRVLADKQLSDDELAGVQRYQLNEFAWGQVRKRMLRLFGLIDRPDEVDRRDASSGEEAGQVDSR